MRCQRCGYVSPPNDQTPPERCPACEALVSETSKVDRTLQLRKDEPGQNDPPGGDDISDEETWGDGDLEERLWLAAEGQKILIRCILLSLVLNAVSRAQTIPALLTLGLSLAIGIYSLVGLLRICSGLEKTQNQKILLMVLAFLPIAGLIAMVYLSVKTTGLLRKAGWKVGLFGGKPCSTP